MYNFGKAKNYPMNKKAKKAKKKPQPDGYPKYSEKEDIYKQEPREENADPENPAQGMTSEREDWPADDLDIPGAELDDAGEDIGEEDEENNYYSLGGENHEDLEEDRS